MGENRPADFGGLSEGEQLMSPELLAILACPNCEVRPPLRLAKDNLLICTECGKGYLIKDGIPDLLPEDAISAEDAKKLENE